MRIAVVLFNLGGPDNLETVEPFLFNLFNDKAIIGLPQPLRWLIAKLISSRRSEEAKSNYAKMGGSSPLLPETQFQADELEKSLKATGLDARCFISMRYWKPFTGDAVKAVNAFNPEKIVLLPLYPQFSTTTTGSSIQAWKKAGGKTASTICCYPTEEGLINAHVDKLVSTWKDNGAPDNLRVLLSAHGLPKKVVDGGDPYQWQIEQTCAAVAKKLPSDWEIEICYQSKVGPLEWISPSTDSSILKAAADGKNILVSPIAFVSEHIETLVELDDEYAELAREHGVTTYLRAPALGIANEFIGGLTNLVRKAILEKSEILSSDGDRICPKNWSKCPHSHISTE
ncbi:ferrochelatase [Hirschia baltica]|uniref:Ferrochelatase n=1 Tax=Hirschia baltica (strain ATCC 49814 / DSM 5838 / IFAM 1418) TaxID=582402 RepID=C6XIL0_HIRBI|nr:ferrochelatase [Hirschia baltica]ACT60817.1 ferrochelatase [Hirschia baltica ATCC 49814]